MISTTVGNGRMLGMRVEIMSSGTRAPTGGASLPPRPRSIAPPPPSLRSEKGDSKNGTGCFPKKSSAFQPMFSVVRREIEGFFHRWHFRVLRTVFAAAANTARKVVRPVSTRCPRRESDAMRCVRNRACVRNLPWHFCYNTRHDALCKHGAQPPLDHDSCTRTSPESTAELAKQVAMRCARQK